MKKLQATVIGNNTINCKKTLSFAEKIGGILAELDIVVITGGKSGIMEAVSKGAKKNNGTTVAILPDDKFSSANNYSDIIIPTGIGYARNMINILAGDFVVAIGGGAGTLSEIAYAWQFGKIIYAYSEAEGWAKNLAGKFIDEKRNSSIIGFSSVEELNDKIKKDFNIF